MGLSGFCGKENMLILLLKKVIDKKVNLNFKLLLILESARQRVLKTNDDVWKDISRQNIKIIPENINGTGVYKLSHDSLDCHKSSKDRQKRKKSIRSDRGHST